jgi:septal ring factor EnvC (AmiA/AmiB activator)
MQAMAWSLHFLLMTFVLGLVTKVKENPIRKITGMLEDMKTELEHEAETEAEVFEKAMCMCETGSKQLSGVISSSTSEIELLTAKIEKDTAGKEKLDKDVEIGEKDKVETERSLAEATAIRENEAAKFAEDEKTTMFSIDQLNRAIPLFAKQGAAGLLQTNPRASFTLRKLVQNTQYLNNHKRSTLLNFIQSGADGKLTPAAQEIIGMMEAMHDEMSSDLADARKTESLAVTSFNDMKENKEEHLGLLMKSIADKSKRSGSLAVAISDDKDSLEDANIELANAQKYLASLNSQCAERRKFRDERAKMRNDEIVAIGEAIKILTEDDSLETFKKAVPSSALVQKPRPTYDAASAALVQKRAQLKKTIKAQNSLKIQRSVVANTHAIRQPGGVNESATAAAKVVHFMVGNMIETLHEDDVSDEHKLAFCDNETTVYEQLRTDKWAFHDQLAKEIEALNNEIDQLKADINALKDAINAMDQSIHDATELRKKEHDEYQVSAQQLSTAAGLIDKATKRLEQFYSPSAPKAAFLSTAAVQPHYTSVVARRLAAGFDDALIQKNGQTVHHNQKAAVDPIVLPDTPTTYEKKESGGVIGLMNKMKSELVTDLREAEVEENHAGEDYAVLMKESKETRDADVKALHNKLEVKADEEEKLAATKKQLDLTNEEIKQIELYLKQLHTECDFLMQNFEKRHDARVDEEHGLDEAESIVTGADVPSYQAIDKVYEEEHTKPEVDEHFPELPMPEVR